MKNIFITGANGFIGRALCDKLLTDGYRVRGAVRSAAQMTTLPSGVEGVMVGDVGPETDWYEALVGIDGIVHLAARVHVMRESSVDPLAAYREVNVEGTKCLAIAAANAGVKRFVYISSVKVNGESTDKSRDQGSGKDRSQKSEVRGQEGEPKEAFSEKDVPGPRDPYGISKWEAEQVLRDVAADTGLEIVILRPPLVYGFGVKANFRSLMKWVRSGVPLPLGAVHNKRSFVALDNLVSFIIHCIDHPKAANEVFLISDGENVSTTELLQKMARAFGKRSFLLSVPVRLMTFVAGLLGKRDVSDRLFGSLQVDSSKARDLLGWKPIVSMDEGLRRMETEKTGNRRREDGDRRR